MYKYLEARYWNLPATVRSNICLEREGASERGLGGPLNICKLQENVFQENERKWYLISA